MSSSRVSVGMIGVGFIGNVHAELLAKDERARLAVVYDADEARAASAAARYGCEAAKSLDEVWPVADAVYITAPNVRHAELALAALRAGKHVFCEKPMATSLADAKAVADAACASSGVFQVGHNRRFAPAYARARESIQSDGPALAAEIKMNRGELENPPWTSDATVTGGFLFETPVHVIDMALHLFGPLASVYARAASRIYPQEDSFAAVLSFRSGLDAALTTCAYTGWSFPFERFEIYGKYLTVRVEELERVEISRGLGAAITAYDFAQLPRDERWGYAEEDRRFLDSMIRGKPAAVTASDGLRVVEAIEAIYRSARERRVVEL